MAKIIESPAGSMPDWQNAGEPVVTIALDRNEVVAILAALSGFIGKVHANTPSGSISGSGARVYLALEPIRRYNGWT